MKTKIRTNVAHHGCGYKKSRLVQTTRMGGIALLTGLCALGMSPNAALSPASAAPKKDPGFSELPTVVTGLPVPKPAPPSTVATQTVVVAEPEPVVSAAETPVAPAPPAPAHVPEDPLVQHAKGKTSFSFRAEQLDLKTALALFARDNNLNIVPDNDVNETVTLDVRDLPLEQVMHAMLDASDLSWHEEGGLIRVRNFETRTFTVDYLRLSRNGRATSSATLNSATSGSGGGGQSGGGGSQSGGGGGSGGSQAGSSVNLQGDNAIDFWKELKEQLGFVLTEKGKSSLAINMTAGLVQVTDRPSALKNVEHFLSSVDNNTHRQVDIEVKLYDVTLNNQFQFGIDWVHVAEAYGGTLGFGGATLPVAAGGISVLDSAIGGLNRNVGAGNVGGNPNTLVFKNFNTAAAVNALQLQGSVEVISQPRVRTLNNQTALIKVGTEKPFFSQSFQSSQSAGGNQTFSGETITTITIGTILSITPQISDDEWISIDISPVLSRLVEEVKSPSGLATAPILDTKQASTLVRVHDGNTIVLGGLIQTENIKSEKKIPLLGDIPWVGKVLFTGTLRSKQKKELVIFVTPRIVKSNETSAKSPVAGVIQHDRMF